MGYLVKIIDGVAVLPSSARDEAYRRLVALNERDDLKTGGRVENGVRVERWFAWLPPNYPEKYDTVEQILGAVGYVVTIRPNGDVSIDGYDSKTGCEGLFLNEIADLFELGSFLTWHGESGAFYQWQFGDGSRLYESVTVLNFTETYPWGAA